MSCPELEQLDRLASGGLDATEAAVLRAHVECCDACRVRLDECRGHQQLLGDVRRLGGWNGGGDRMPAADARTQVLDSSSCGAGPIDDIPGYRFIREIHRGGQGIVYEAIQEGTEMPVAIKVLLQGAFADERSRWRFEQEVRLIASLKHPKIVAIHDSGIAHGKHYFVMDCVRGLPLDSHVRLNNLSSRQIIALVRQVCDAVAYAHQRGVVHRDLKPSNILVGEDGEPRILDFGLAKILDEDRGGSARDVVTVTGQVLGTLPYMSPEQTAGRSDAIDTRTDVYSLGVILYELLTGSPPYATLGQEVLQAIENIRSADPARPSRLRKGLKSEIDAMVLKAMAKDPERRYQSAGELGADLDAWLDGRPVSARSDSALYVLRKIAVRHSYETTVALTLFAAVAVFGTITFQYYLRASAAREQQILSDANAEAAQQDMGAFFAEGKSVFRQQGLGWFLLEWREGRLDRAREIQAGLDAASPEHAAMSFLLDEGQTVGDLRGRLPAGAGAMVHFVAGERHLKAGRRDEALREFEMGATVEQPDRTGNAGAATGKSPYEWFRRSAEARLRQLRGSAAIAGAAAPIGRADHGGKP